MANSVGKGFPTTNLQIGHVFCDSDDLTLWEFVGGNPALVASWRLMQGAVNEQPETSQWGLAQAGAVWFFNDDKTYYGWNGTTVVPIAFDGSPGLYNYRYGFTLQDEFLSGTQSSSQVGSLGWVTAGGVAAQSAEANSPGLYRFSTGAVINTISRLSTHNSSAFDPSTYHRISWLVRVNTPDANTTVRFGAANSVAGNPPNNGIVFEKLAADTNWFAVVYSGAVLQHRIDTGIAVSASFVSLMYEYNPATASIGFFVNRQLVVTISNPVIPAAFISPYGFIINTAAADKTFDVDYFDMIVKGITR